MKCKKCGMELEIEPTTFEARFRNRKTGEIETETYTRNRYRCDNPDCEYHSTMDLAVAEPECDHEYLNKDFGEYAFEHCHLCKKCGYFICVDSSG